MDEAFSYVCQHADKAHWIIFFLLLLAGLNIPISEDLLVLAGGAIASTCIPDHTLKIYVWIFLGSYLSAWEAYWIGRLGGPRLHQMALFKSIITPKRVSKLKRAYAKYGIWTFIIGRFCPGGVRNGLFMTSGLTKMPFLLFILRDGLACLISSLTLFYIGYHFGENIHNILYYLNRYEHWVLFIFLVVISTGLFYVYYKIKVCKK